MAHLDPREDRSETRGWLNGKQVFRSHDLRGLITYGRKHGVTLVECGECISGDGLYTVTFGNGATSRGTFASPSIMLGFFLGRTFVERVECCRGVFNKGTSFGRVAIPFLCDIGRNGSANFYPWIATAYRDATGTPLVSFVRR